MTALRKLIFPWRLCRLPAFLLPLLSLLLYLPALHHGFIMDDRWLIVENPYIKGWQYLPQMLTQDAWNIWDRHNYWRPVFSISLALDYSLWGLNPLGFHLTNILLHAANTTLLYLLGRRLQNSACALFAALFFGLHPIQVHAVNVISTRGDLLAAFFTLLSLHAFFSRRTVLFPLALMLAALSKETSMVLPLAVLFAWIIVEKGEQGSRLILAFVVLGLYLGVRYSLGFSFSLPRSIFSYETYLAGRLLLACKVLALYCLALFNLFQLPHPFWTAEIPTSVTDPYVLSGISIFGLVMAAILGNLKRNSILAFGLIWFVVYFLPISNLKELNQPMAEHWLYIPMLGLGLAFGAALDDSFLRLPSARLARVGITTGVAVFLIFGFLVAGEKSRIYRNDEAFLLAAMRANPQVPRLYSFMGTVYLTEGDIHKAKEFYAQALVLDPHDFLANYRFGFILHQTGQPSDAEIYLRRIVQVAPQGLWQILPVAHAWEMLGDKEKALFYYRKALDLNPDSVQTKEKIAGLENLQGPKTGPPGSPP